MKKFKPLYTFASLWKQFVLFTKNWRRKPTGELVVKDKLECFENIVDKDGHKRFIEGEGTIINMPENFVVTYNRWSLCGTHLMIVLAFTANSTTIGTGDVKIQYALPDWVKTKIVSPAENIAVVFNEFSGTTAGATTTKQGFALLKGLNNVELQKYYNGTFANNSYYRVQFDLLIDNAESE